MNESSIILSLMIFLILTSILYYHLYNFFSSFFFLWSLISIGIGSSFLLGLMYIFSTKTLKNFKRNEKFATLMLFTQPKAAFCFRLLSILSLWFALSMILRVFMLILNFPFSIPITSLSMLTLSFGFVYFAKTLARVTREREAEIVSIKEK